MKKRSDSIFSTYSVLETWNDWEGDTKFNVEVLDNWLCVFHLTKLGRATDLLRIRRRYANYFEALCIRCEPDHPVRRIGEALGELVEETEDEVVFMYTKE